MADQTQAQPYSRVDQLYVVIARANDQAPKLTITADELLRQHRAYLKQEHDKETLVGSGPGQDHDDKRYVGAVMLLRCASLAEATALAHREPYIREKQRIPEIIPWRRVWFEKEV